MALALLAMVGVDVGVAWWLFASAAEAFYLWLFLVVAVAAIAWELGPHGFPCPFRTCNASRSGPTIRVRAPMSGAPSPHC